jgi:hypothetical protein
VVVVDAHAGEEISEGPVNEMAIYPGHPAPSKKSLEEHVEERSQLPQYKLNRVLDAAQAGTPHVFFVDAAHFVFGTFLCCMWSFVRLWVRAASGRQRFNVLGA